MYCIEIKAPAVLLFWPPFLRIVVYTASAASELGGVNVYLLSADLFQVKM
jgi:hypothetical protein